MRCECGYPIFPQAVIIREGFFTRKEIPNITEWTCMICHVKYKLKSFKGNIEILEKLY